MKLDCIHCKNELSLTEELINLEGKIIKCEYCSEEWIYHSRTYYLESRLTELDQDLVKKESQINEQNIKYSERINQLEKD